MDEKCPRIHPFNNSMTCQSYKSDCHALKLSQITMKHNSMYFTRSSQPTPLLAWKMK